MSHVFRFFVDQDQLAENQLVALGDSDQRHLRVIRARDGDQIELVDRRGSCAQAEVADRGTAARVVSIELRGGAPRTGPRVVLLAPILMAGPWSAMVDMAVQAGVDEIIPWAASERERAIDSRRQDRTERVVVAAAKQSKRRTLPRIRDAVRLEDLASQLDPDVGGSRLLLCCDADAPSTLAAMCARLTSCAEIVIAIGPSAGWTTEQIEHVQSVGFTSCRLGATVLRSELAAAIAIATVAQSFDRRDGQQQPYSTESVS